jgi:hypothetical protein
VRPIDVKCIFYLPQMELMCGKPQLDTSKLFKNKRSVYKMKKKNIKAFVENLSTKFEFLYPIDIDNVVKTLVGSKRGNIVKNMLELGYITPYIANKVPPFKVSDGVLKWKRTFSTIMIIDDPLQFEKSQIRLEKITNNNAKTDI